ncbi:MAG: hypothetical protein P0Y53_06420 [Candidatus Pseudobacter hemicellulosilyticus]|uniref:DUF4384 domain-containing protein n=1 Tax=Candidatus Pseudobacter hemicellulosilyticus TaxID=3121375 RepID=A0AAJ6BGW8_9BACT|nr:MAG: hypothetical protein P0Y53_06420 [Pseudobacter sp.]
MKTQPAKTATKANHSRSILLAAILLIVSTATLKAQSAADSTGSSSDSITRQVKHLGNIGANMVFQVQYANPTGERFLVQIKDGDNTTLFQEAFTAKKFDRKFRVPRAEQGQLTFIIKGNRNTTVLESFEVNTSTRVVEEIVVQKMN